MRGSRAPSSADVNALPIGRGKRVTPGGTSVFVNYLFAEVQHGGKRNNRTMSVGGI